MATYRSFKCSSCGALLHVNGDRGYIYCEYCGTQNVLEGYEGKYGSEDDEDEDEFSYHGPFDRELELERLRMKERDKIRDHQEMVWIFLFMIAMFIVLGFFKAFS